MLEGPGVTRAPHRRKALAWAGLLLCALVLWVAPARAHLMAAQKGTLNLVGGSAFLVLSVPVSALKGWDDDADGALSRAELRAHGDGIRAQVQAGVRLLGPDGPAPLHLVMVDVASPDNAPDTPAGQLTVLGRFQLMPDPGHAASSPDPAHAPLSLRFTLFGAGPDEQQQDLTITRQADRQWLRFTPQQSTHALLPGAMAVLAEYVGSGAAHVLSGVDHLLFLLVALSAGLGWRALLAVLSCFTAGHALALAASVWGVWSAPASIVEPAIAATIVGLAAFDVWVRRRTRPVSTRVRLLVVFACALVHGLGLAQALTDLSQWPVGSPAMLWALAGFNLGIELAQAGVAALVALVCLGLARVSGPALRRQALRAGRS